MKEDHTPWLDATGGYAKDMSLRDYLAAQAMPIGWAMAKEWFEIDEPEKMIGQIAYDIADAMLGARDAAQ